MPIVSVLKEKNCKIYIKIQKRNSSKTSLLFVTSKIKKQTIKQS